MLRHSTLATVLTIATLLLGTMLLPACSKSEPSIAGTYTLEKDAVKAALREEINAIEDPEERMMAQMVLGFIDSLEMSITLNDDKTASAVTRAMNTTDTATGTWSRSGENITITLAPPDLEPQSMRGTIRNDTLELHSPETEDVNYRLIFRSQSSK